MLGTGVFKKPIVYSTNANFEGVYLYSLFRKDTMRSFKEWNKNFKDNKKDRDYDIVIVDEVDNMLIDQQGSPAIISRPFNIMFSTDILQIVYLLQKQSVEDILKVLEYYFKDGPHFDIEIVRKMKHAAQTAVLYEKGVHYIVDSVKVENTNEDDDKFEKAGDLRRFSEWSYF